MSMTSAEPAPDRSSRRAAAWLALSLSLAMLGLVGGLVQKQWSLPLAGCGSALVILLYVRERHRGAKLQRAFQAVAEAQREFVATVSHDLRSPLTAIFGFSQLLTDEASLPPERQRAYTAMIREQAACLARMIEDTVDLARITDGILGLRLAECAAAEVAQESLLLFTPPCERERVHVAVASELPLLWADRYECEQVLDRIVHAALVHSLATEVAPVTLQIGYRRGMVQFTMHAPGLAIEHEAFAPLRGSLEEAEELGRHDQRCLPLATARALVELQGGCMWTAEHETTGETAICFALPAVRRPAPEKPATPKLVGAPATAARE